MRTLTVKLYGSDDFRYLSDMINIAGIIYNTALTIIEDHYTETGKLLDKYELQKQLRSLRNVDENHHWRYVGSQAVQEITDRIYRSYRLFFTNREKGVKCSPPCVFAIGNQQKYQKNSALFPKPQFIFFSTI